MAKIRLFARWRLAKPRSMMTSMPSIYIYKEDVSVTVCHCLSLSVSVCLTAFAQFPRYRADTLQVGRGRPGTRRGEGLKNCGVLRGRGLGRGGSRNLFWGGPNQGRKLRAKPESRARSARVSRAKPESRARSARELRAKPEPRAKPEKKRREGSGEGARWAPPQKIFEKSNLKSFILVHIWSNYLKWLTKWFNCHFHEKSLVIVWCDGIIKFCWSIKFDRGSGGRSPPEAKTF